MAYTTLAEVRALLPHKVRLGMDTEPSEAQVQVWINQCEAMVDVALSAGGLTSPATNATQVLAIAGVVSGEVCWLVMGKQTGKADDEAAGDQWDALHKQFQDAIELMRKGTWAPTSGTAKVASLYTMDSVHGTVSEDPSIDPKVGIEYEY